MQQQQLVVAAGGVLQDRCDRRVSGGGRMHAHPFPDQDVPRHDAADAERQLLNIEGGFGELVGERAGQFAGKPSGSDAADLRRP